MSVFEALLLGIIQGLTEFLPVSSSGHIEIGKAILGTDAQNDNLRFSIVVHAATALSTIIIFRKDILRILLGFFKFKGEEFTFALQILLSAVPAGIIGILFKDDLEQLFNANVGLVGLMLIFNGLILFLSGKAGTKAGKPTFGKAFAVGLAQAVAILPGISRSGSTIGTSLLLGIGREEAARFSFLMALVPIGGAMLLETKDLYEESGILTGTEIAPLVVGFAAAFLTGLFACTAMIKLVKNGQLNYFSIYCVLAGLSAVVYAYFIQ